MLNETEASGICLAANVGYRYTTSGLFPLAEKQSLLVIEQTRNSEKEGLNFLPVVVDLARN